MRPVRALPVIAAILALTGCGADAPPLPPPGASGTVVFHLWDARLDRPTVVVAERVRQEGFRFDLLELEPVSMRLALPEGDIAVEAPSATWAATGGQGTLTLAGPVRLAGTYRQKPLFGRAESARVDQARRTLLLDQFELYHDGARLRAPVAELREDRTIALPAGAEQDEIPPWLAASFAPLPSPLVLPRWGRTP
jgi:hypothetical protein